MSMIAGVVADITKKDVTTKFGVKPTYAIKVNGNWIKCGFKDPKVEIGYTIDCDAVAGTYGLETKSVNITSRTVTTKPYIKEDGAVEILTAVPSSTPTKSYGGYKEKVFPIPPLHGDRAIVRQNALARATDLYIAARGGKAFELDPSTLDLVIKLARKFEGYTAGDIDLEDAMKENEAEAINPTKE